MTQVCKEFGLDLISLIAPTSHERISMIAREASGFVYCVSSLGVTGMRSEITTDIGQMIGLVKAQKDIPCAVGFGISTSDQAKKMAGVCDGVIVGSAIVKICEEYKEDCVPYVADYVRKMKAADCLQTESLFYAGNSKCFPLLRIVTKGDIFNFLFQKFH